MLTVQINFKSFCKNSRGNQRPTVFVKYGGIPRSIRTALWCRLRRHPWSRKKLPSWWLLLIHTTQFWCTTLARFPYRPRYSFMNSSGLVGVQGGIAIEGSDLASALLAYWGAWKTRCFNCFKTSSTFLSRKCSFSTEHLPPRVKLLHTVRVQATAVRHQENMNRVRDYASYLHTSSCIGYWIMQTNQSAIFWHDNPDMWNTPWRVHHLHWC